MTDTERDVLKLSNQLCFPLYAAAKSVVAKYTPHLDAIGLTYTQYITMMVLWERGEISVKELGENLRLDSGTLTPLLKKLETKGYVERRRSAEDERSVIVKITQNGAALREKAVEVPLTMAGCMPLSQEEAETLYGLLYKILGAVD
jgi:DNA-binding MarR family transcriptional regulator